MQSKTLSFNKTIFWKTVTRFWPIWFLYTGIWTVLMPVSNQITLRNSFYRSNFDAVVELESIISSMAAYGGLIMGAIFAVISAMAVWSFMYTTRSTHGMASLPIRREGVFCSVTLAGIAPLFAANVLIFLLTLGVQLVHGCTAITSLLEWFGAVNLFLIFYYGFATFCAQLTGNIGVLPAVYAVLNFTAVVVEAIIRSISEFFIYGFTTNSNFTFMFLSPPAKMLEKCRSRSIWELDPVDGSNNVIGYVFEGWGTVAIYAAVGLVMLALALLLYRRRRMETAGDVVAVNLLKPVFKYCLTFGCALVLGMAFYSLIFLSYSNDPSNDWFKLAVMSVFMLIGGFIGYFTAEMLNSKSFRVWKGRWLGMGVSALIIIAVMSSIELDLLGLESYVPRTEKLESVVLRVDGETVVLDEPENIQAVTALHESIISNKDHYESTLRSAGRHGYDGYNTTGLRIGYSVGGRYIERYYVLPYYLNEEDSYMDSRSLQNIVNCSEAILDRKATAFQLSGDNVFGANISISMTGAELAALEGYSNTEDFLLCYYEGMNPGEIAALEEETRSRLLLSIVERECANLDEEFWKYAEFYSVTSSSDIDIEYSTEYAEAVPIPTKEGYSFDPALLEKLELDNMYFRYNIPLSTEQIMELYNQCIVPDIAEGTLGRIWIINDREYEDTVYSAEISIDARVLRESEDGERYDYTYFYTVPTVDSHRTNRWLEEAGFKLHTLSDIYYNSQPIVK